MYRLPEESKPGDYAVTREVVRGEVDLFKSSRRAKKEPA
jgi:hypothetical protein